MNNHLESYLNSLSRQNKSKGTINSYESEIIKFLEYADKPSIEVNSIDVEDYIGYVTEKHDYKPKTSNRKLYTLRAYFDYLLEHEIINKNPARVVKPAIIDKKAEPEYLNIDDINKFLNTIDNVRDIAIIKTFLYTGLRRGELVSLNKSNINLKSGYVLFWRKGHKENKLPLHPEAIKALREYLKTRKDNNEALFISNRGTRIADNTINAIVLKYKKKARFKRKITPHTLRHSFATMTYKLNKDIKTLQELLGHSDISTTQIYTHTDNEQKKQNINSLPTF